MNYKVIKQVLGWVIGLEGALMLLPLICAVIYREPCVKVFALCMAICIAIGGLMIISTPKNKAMYAKEGFVIVALSWILISVFGALPFIISGAVPDWSEALFETVSGFSTTGSSVINDVEALPKSLLFWRSFTHWIGGMGILVFLVAVLPLSGGNNLYMIKAESPGPAVGKLVPKIRSMAKILYLMYMSLTVIEIIFLLAGGMDLFEALTITFGTAGTGGFGVRNSGCADYTTYQQVIIGVFMMLFGIDFSVYYLLLMRKFKEAFSSEEVRTYLGVIITATVIISLNCIRLFSGAAEALKEAFFQVASIITTTGYSTCDFDRWPELSKTILVVLMFIGACAGSTGGGMKISRILILLKSIVKEIKIAAHPQRTYKITMNGRMVSHEVIRAVNVYMGAYLVIFAVSLLIISIDNFDFTTNFTAVASAMNNIGPGLAKVGPMCNFSGFSTVPTLVLTFDMLIGRLEIFPIFVLFSPWTWKK